MGFPLPAKLKLYLKKLVEIETYIEPQYRCYWFNDSWMPGVEAGGYIHGDGSYWIIAFNGNNALLKSYSPEETSNYGLIFPEDLPVWAAEIYNNPLWDPDTTTSLVIGYSDGVWEEPWLAKAWWPIHPLHIGLPFTESNFNLWFESLGHADSADLQWILLSDLWKEVYSEPCLEWEAVGEGVILEKTCDI